MSDGWNPPSLQLLHPSNPSKHDLWASKYAQVIVLTSARILLTTSLPAHTVWLQTPRCLKETTFSIHAFYGSWSVPQGQKDVRQVTNTQNYTAFLKYKILRTFHKTVQEDCLNLEDGIDRLSRNVGNYQSTLRNIPEERNSKTLAEAWKYAWASICCTTLVTTQKITL